MTRSSKLHRLSRLGDEVANLLAMHDGPVARVERVDGQVLEVAERGKVDVHVVVSHGDGQASRGLRASAPVNGVAHESRPVLGIVKRQVAVRVARHVKDFEMPGVTQANDLSPGEAEVHLAGLAGVRRGVRVEAHVVVGAEKVITNIVERAGVLHQGAVGGATTEPRAGRGALDGVIAALMVEVSVRGDRERQALGTELERIHVGEDDLLGVCAMPVSTSTVLSPTKRY